MSGPSETAQSTNQKKNSTVSRRAFIGGAIGAAAVGAAAGFGGGYLLAPKTASNLVLPIPSSWDDVADVLVVGGGGAGLAAAVGALEGNAKVIVLEKASAVGGTTALSGGGMWVPNSSLAVTAGSPNTISQSNLSEYLTAIGEGEEDQDLISAYLQQAPGWIDHLINAYGMKFSLATTFICYYNKPGSQGAGLQVSPTGGGPGISGAGKGLIQVLQNAVTKMGGTIMVSTSATALYQDATGRVLGVKATSGGSDINIKAAKGVILAAGGYDNNPGMMAFYQRGPQKFTSAVAENTGDGILMAMAAGAEIRNMNNAWGCPHYNTGSTPIADWGLIRGKPGAIIVNRFGERFANESSAYPVVNRAFFEWDTGIYDYRNIPAYAIVDSDCYKRYGFVTYVPGSTPPSYVSTANTLQDLASALGIDPSGLQETVNTFNGYVATGVDLDFHRGEFSFDLNTCGDPKRTDLKNICLGPVQTPPFYGLEIDPGTIGTSGGPRINANGQVLDQQGNPMPGLYAAGNDSASPFGAAYPGGGATVGPATVFGWLAGKAAAAAASS
jgi:succinate dehydrogenase/fumarate reductase flavoprotein subunit